MFWKRTTGHGAFCGLLAGTAAAALTHGLTVAEGKGGWIANVYEDPQRNGASIYCRCSFMDSKFYYYYSR